jgi:hypothetical protein
MKVHTDEEATVNAFITPARRERWLEALASAKRRKNFLDRLNHCPDIDERYATLLPSNAEIAAVLRSHGAPALCHVISDLAEIDGQMMELDDVIDQIEFAQWGTLISCIPGRLAYYYDESGARRMLLQRDFA